MAPAEPDPSSARRILPTVFLATFFIRFGYGITVSIFALYLGTTVAVVGVAAALAPVLEFSTVLFSGLAADRYGRFPVLRAGLLVGAVLLVGMSLSRNALWETGLNAAFGVCSGAILAASLAFTGDASGAGERGLEMGFFDGVNLAGWIAGFAAGYILAGTLPADHLGEAFWVGAAASLVALLLLEVRTWGLTEARADRFFDLGRLRTAILRADVLLVVLPWATIYMLIGALFTYLGTSAKSLDIPTWELGVAIGVVGGLLLLTQPFYGRLADRWGRRPVMAIGILGFLGVLACASVLAVDQFHHRWISDPAVGGIALSALAALAFGPSSLAALADVSHRFSRGTTMSLYSMMVALGMALGILLASGLYTLWGSYGVVAFFGVVAVFLVVLTLARMHHEGRALAGAGGDGPGPPAAGPA